MQWESNDKQQTKKEIINMLSSIIKEKKIIGSNEDDRNRFLIGLQGILGIRRGIDFSKIFKLNDNVDKMSMTVE